MDYRRRSIEYKDEGHTFKELLEVFKVSSTTYYDWKMKFESGYYEHEHKFERKGKIDKDALANAISKTPDAYLRELAEPFNCTEQAVFYALKKLRITYKKKRLPTAKNPRRSGRNI